MVAVKMREECNVEFGCPKSRNPSLESRIGLPHHAWPGVHQIGLSVRNDCQ
jgi:hypothetical protein